MELCDINPFMRYAALQGSVLSSPPLSCAYDYRIFYIIEGQTTLVLETERIPLSAGTLLYFRPGTPYYFDGKVKVFVLNFDMTRAHAACKKPLTPSKDLSDFDPSLIFENEPPRELEGLLLAENAFAFEEKLRECLLHYCYPTGVSDAATSAIIKELLCYLAQGEGRERAELPEPVQRITLYIQQNYDREISNTEISAALGYHSFYLNRIFKKSTGITIHQAVLREKMRVAKRLLRDTALPVHSIAAEVGFPERSQFCTLFRKQVGRTPTEYRQGKETK